MNTQPAGRRAQALKNPPLRAAVSAAALLLVALAPAQAAVPSLGFNSSAQIYGSMSTRYDSPLLGGPVSFSVSGASDYKSNYSGSGQRSTGVASVDYNVATGQQGSDPVYDIITGNGRYGFSYSGQAEVAGLNLRTRIASSSVDGSTGTAVASAGDTSLYANAYSQWNQSFYIGATASHAAGSYGAILVGITLDGNFPPSADAAVRNGASTYLQAASSFSDTAGVSYQSSFYISTSAGDPNWNGRSTVYKKLLFQYGTVFSFNLYQQAYSYNNNGSADFFNTGKISQIEIPFQAVLVSGAEQAGLGPASALYGTLINSATADAQNTNWDFGNNGGGFTPNVPEPQSAALMLAGLLGLGRMTWRRRRD